MFGVAGANYVLRNANQPSQPNHATMRLRQGKAEEAPGDGRHRSDATNCRTWKQMPPMPPMPPMQRSATGEAIVELICQKQFWCLIVSETCDFGVSPHQVVSSAIMGNRAAMSRNVVFSSSFINVAKLYRVQCRRYCNKRIQSEVQR